MPSFKTVAATVAGLTAVSASSYKHEPVYTHFRSDLEDLDLAAGRNPFTGSPFGEQDDMNDIFSKLGSMGGSRVIINGVPVEKNADGKYDPEIEELFGNLGRFGGSGLGGHGSLGSRYGKGNKGGMSGSPFGSFPGFDDMPSSFGGRRPATGSPAGEPTTASPVAQPEESEESEEAQEPVPSRGGRGGETMEELLERLGGMRGASGGRFGEPQKPSEPLKMDNPAGSPFRIQVDYSTLKFPSEKHVNYIKNLLMPAVVDFFTSTLKIKYPLKQNQKCPRYSNVEIPSKYITEGVKDADLVILVSAENDPRSGAIAGAGSLVADARSGRSVLATVNFNFAHIPVDETDEMALSRAIYTTVHELTHVLGFSDDQFANFLNPDGTRQKENALEVELGGDRMTLLDVEPLTTRLRKHFGCDKIQGAPMEDNGGAGTAGSHFERRIFFNEYMTGSDMHDTRISEFTLALLEGTGWYVVDYSKAEPYTFGKGQGCDFFYGKCTDSRGNPKFSDFCSKNDERECTLGGYGAAVCRVDAYSNGCGLPYAEERLDCRSEEGARYTEALRKEQVFGPTKGSKCFVGDVVEKGYRTSGKASYCLNYKCNGTGAATTLDVILGKATVKCTKKEAITVDGYSGKIDCPDPIQFCADSAPYCSKGCLGRGECVNGTCHCKPGFTGSDCVYPPKH